MEKRLPLALALSLLFFWLYVSSFPPPAQPSGSGPPPSSASSPAREGAPPATSASASTLQPPRLDEPDIPLAALRLDTEDAESEWTNQGAALSWLRLLDYRTAPPEGEPLPLVGAAVSGEGSLRLRDLSGLHGLDKRRWHALEEDAPDGRRLVFELQAAGGLLFRRTVRAGSEPHTVELSLHIENRGPERSENLSLVLESASGLMDEEAGSVFYGRPAALAVVVGPSDEPSVVKWAGDDLREGQPRAVADNERLLAAGTATNYFASVIAPAPETDVRQVFPRDVLDHLKLERAVAAEQPRDEAEAQRRRSELAPKFRTAAAAELQLLVRRLEPGESQRFDFRVYSGPKAVDVAARPGLEFLAPIIESDYGSMAWINRTLLWILRSLHGVVSNWGVAIILLTVLVKAILFPLNRRQQTSMSRYSSVMQRLKPQLDELKAKYKSNVRKFNEEQMKLLREHGATPPLGGCLLPFLQLPIWISLFQILGTSIELRQSAFIGWIDDLSRPDRLMEGVPVIGTINLLPLLMSAATIVQMRFQPKPADANQAQMQKIMGIFMPLMMLWFLYDYSAGLSLYIFTSSLLGIFEFQVIRRIWPVPGAPGAVGGGSPPAQDPPSRRGQPGRLARA